MTRVLRALIETILPFEQPDFPAIGVARVERVLLARFPIDRDEPGGGMARAFAAFDDTSRFVACDEPLRTVEADLGRAAGAAGDAGTDEVGAWIARKVRAEVARFDVFARAHGQDGAFQARPLAARRAYLRLWARSDFALRRRFYAAVKSMVLVSAYAVPALARAIGYDGPMGRDDVPDAGAGEGAGEGEGGEAARRGARATDG